MYLNYFNLTRFPFQNTPDPAFFFSSRSHKEALASMIYGIEQGKGFVLVTGDVGTGKTLLVQALKKELLDRHILIEIANPWTTPEDVLDAIRVRINVTTSGDNALFDSLRERLIALSSEGQRVVLIIDEAHQLSERMIEGIRLLSNIETNTEKLLQIIFLGQDELASMLSKYSMRQVQQRISLGHRLQCFNSKETAEYIEHRLRVAGGTPLLFPSDCVELIHQAAMGTPRVINRLCDSCLLFAFGRKSSQVTVDIVRDAVANLNLDQPVIAQASSAPEIPAPKAPILDQTVPVAVSTPVSSAIESMAALTTSVTPATPTVSENTLPFKLPGANLAERTTAVQVKNVSAGNSGLGIKHLLLALGLGLAAGALGLWYMQQSAGKVSGRESKIGVLDTNMHSMQQATPSTSSPRVQIPASLPAVPQARSAAPMPGQMQLPGNSVFPLPTQEVTIPPHGGLGMLASNYFGSWNETVRELIAAVNPSLANNMETLPPGTKLKFPVLTRSGLVVPDSDGRYYIYFASFDKADDAQASLDAIRRTWNGAQLILGDRGGVPIHRLFVGAFANQAEAKAAANTLWFKFIPVLN